MSDEQGCSSSIAPRPTYRDDYEDDDGAGPSNSQNEPGPSKVYVNPLAGMYDVVEIPPFRPGLRLKPITYKKTLSTLTAAPRKHPKRYRMPTEIELSQYVGDHKRNVAWARAYNLLTDEEIETLPASLIPRSIPVVAQYNDLPPTPTPPPSPTPVQTNNRARRGRVTRVVQEKWTRIRNFFRRIRRVMVNFFGTYTNSRVPTRDPTPDYFEAVSRPVVVDGIDRRSMLTKEKLNVHFQHLHKMEEGNRKPTPHSDIATGKETKLSQEYIDFVMYKDLKPLVELKKLRELETELALKLEDTKNGLLQLREDHRQAQQTGLPDEEEKEEDEEDESTQTDPLLGHEITKND